jgi:hypothetical protein
MWLGFTGLYSMFAVCPVCGQPSCPVGIASAGTFGAVLTVLSQSWKGMAGLFGRLGRKVGGKLGYGYRDGTERRIPDYCMQVMEQGSYDGRTGGGPDEGG